MDEEIKIKKHGDFATSGSESFDLNGEKEEKKRPEDQAVVLNITENIPSVGVVLDTEDADGKKGGGNIFTDIADRVNEYLVTHSSVRINDKANFFHLLSVMINAGVPMVESLTSLEKQSEKSPRLQQVLNEIRTAIESGASLSEAMAEFPDVFSEQDLGMVQAGELSGKLNEVLEEIAHDTTKSYQIRAKVKSAMMYPAVIMCLLIIVIVAMLVFVIPQLSELFATSGENLPFITRAMIAMSDFLIEKKLLLVVGLLSLFMIYSVASRTDGGRYAIDKFKLRLPIFGKLIMQSCLSKFARSIGNLLGSSLSIVRTVEITAHSIGNEVYKKKLLLCMEDLKQGIPLAESITNSDLFPLMLVNMISVGEKTAQLDEITAKVADFYEEEVDTSVRGLSKLIEPIIIVAMGLSVGAVVAAVMLPIMQLSDMASKM